MHRPPGASTVHLPPGPWATVLDALSAQFPRVPRATWHARLHGGRVLDAEGRPLAEDAPHRAGMCVHYFREVDVEPPVPEGETILYADGTLVVADKPHFLPVTPSGPWVENTLLARLRRRLDNPYLVPLHRIDRHTAGLVLLSADPVSRDAYMALFRERRVDKGYEALAAPLPHLDLPHVRRSRLQRGEPFFRMCEAEGASNSETRVDVIERGRTWWRYALTPVTGRKHQLRVHMAALGAPILNDPFYPHLQPEGPDDPARPLQLLARILAFTDPLTGERREWHSRRRLEVPEKILEE